MRLVFPRSQEISDATLSDFLNELYPWPTDTVWVRANMVSTLDGKAQGPNGLSGGISPVADKLVFHHLRSTADVVLVGAGTVRAENYGPLPSTDAQQTPPRLAIVSGQLNLDANDRIFSQAREFPQDPMARPLVLTTAKAPSEKRAELESVAQIVDCAPAQINGAAIVDALVQLGHRRIHCEGGPSILSELMHADLLDELDISLAPLLVDGQALSILQGSPLQDGPRSAELAHVLQAESLLMLRYLIRLATPQARN